MVLLSFAGFDPSAGAGVLLDVRVFRGRGFHGAAVVTALTVQNTSRVTAVEPVPGRLVRAQYNSLAKDMRFAGMKVGMAGSAVNLTVIGRILARRPDIPRVVDPVFAASSGAPLLEKDAVASFLAAVRRRATVLTPNLAEAARLSGRPVRTPEDMGEAAEIIFDRTQVACVVKGGHLEGDPLNLLFDGRRVHLFGKRRLDKDVHGTGCFFSASLLAYLARRNDLAEACRLATEATHRAILKAAPVGRGRAVISV
jgi:hydroxymethylpyrimidine/phosphomethylpyrimidine kinase